MQRGPVRRDVRAWGVMGKTAAALGLVLLTCACASSTTSTPTASAQASAPPVAGSEVPLDATTVARFVGSANVVGEHSMRIDIEALGPGEQAFSPTLITGSPGQTLSVTVVQKNDLSADYQHNFSIDALGIDRDVPKGAGGSITVMVALPDSGNLIFYCKYHVSEDHAGTFVVG